MQLYDGWQYHKLIHLKLLVKSSLKTRKGCKFRYYVFLKEDAFLISLHCLRTMTILWVWTGDTSVHQMREIQYDETTKFCRYYILFLIFLIVITNRRSFKENQKWNLNFKDCCSLLSIPPIVGCEWQQGPKWLILTSCSKSLVCWKYYGEFLYYPF